MVCFRRNFRAHFRELPWRSGRDHMYAWYICIQVIAWTCLMSNLLPAHWGEPAAWTNPTKWSIPPANTRICLGICPVWSVFAVCMKRPWALSYPLSAQQRLIRLGRGHFVGFVMLQLKWAVWWLPEAWRRTWADRSSEQGLSSALSQVGQSRTTSKVLFWLLN